MILNKIKSSIATIAIIFTFCIFIQSCSVSADPPKTTATPPVKSENISLTGMIRKSAVSGNCYQFTANDGKNYELIGTFPKRDGVKVQVSGSVATDVATICQVGQPFQVKSIQVLK
jgi:hypothetical protein